MVITGPQQGWQCPLCKNIYSPTTSMCYSCSSSKVTITSSSDSVGNEIQLPNGTITLPHISRPTSSNVLFTTVKGEISNTFPDNPTEGQNPNFPYEV